MTTPALFEWLYALPLSTYVRESLYLYPALDVTHVVGVILLLGSIAVVDLRLLGKVFPEVPIGRLSHSILPLTFVGAALAFTSGILLFLSEAETIWSNPMLVAKFALLVLAAINIGTWHLPFARHRPQWDTLAVPPLRARIAGGTSLALWASILVCGRLIAFIF
jgi:hypothetical protein